MIINIPTQPHTLPTPPSTITHIQCKMCFSPHRTTVPYHSTECGSKPHSEQVQFAHIHCTITCMCTTNLHLSTQTQPQPAKGKTPLHTCAVTRVQPASASADRSAVTGQQATAGQLRLWGHTVAHVNPLLAQLPEGNLGQIRCLAADTGGGRQHTGGRQHISVKAQ